MEILLEKKKKKNKKDKRKTSKRLRNAQNLEVGLSTSARRVANAIEIGLSDWDKRRKREKGIDGALGLAWKNGVFSAGRTLREASWAPSDLFTNLGPKMDPRRIFTRAILPFWR